MQSAQRDDQIVACERPATVEFDFPGGTVRAVLTVRAIFKVAGRSNETIRTQVVDEPATTGNLLAICQDLRPGGVGAAPVRIRGK
jgi:hypothetical protein